MNQLFTKRPDCQGRLEKEIRTYDLLDSLGISYVGLDHEEAKTIDDCMEIDLLLEIPICKNLLLCNTQKTNFYLLMMPGDKKFKTNVLSKQIESARLSFAPAEYMVEYLDITPGSVSIMGLMNDKDLKVHLLIDQDVISAPYIACHPCINTTSIKILTSDILDVFLPYIKHPPTIVHL